MHPSIIAEKEAKFAGDLKLANGTRLELKSVKDIGNEYTVRSIRPANQNYFYKNDTKKKSICLHFTVGNILSDVAALTKADSHISVSYVVDRSGNIYELFPDNFWSYHLGNGAIGGNTNMSKQSIGIKISNYGPLTEKDGNMVDTYGNTYCSTWETNYYERRDYRGKSAFATMPNVQVCAVATLVEYLCDKHSIPMTFSCTDEIFRSADEALSFEGIFMHSNVRKDKFDWPMCEAIESIVVHCVPPLAKAEPEQVPPTDIPEAPTETLTEEESSAKPAEEPAEYTEAPSTAAQAPGAANVPKRSSLGGMLKKLLRKITGMFRKN